MLILPPCGTKHLYLKDGSINPDLLDRPIIIWGCGNDGRKLYRLLQNQKIKAAAFCDSNRDLINSLYNDTPVISCEEAMEKGGINLALAFHQWMSVKDTIKVKNEKRHPVPVSVLPYNQLIHKTLPNTRVHTSSFALHILRLYIRHILWE